MAGSGWGASGAGAVPLGILVPVLVLLSGLTGLGATSPSTPDLSGAGRAAESSAPAAPDLTISPNSTWAEAGNATPFAALWTSGSSACTVAPVWFHWFVGVGSVGGQLSAPNASTVNLTGASVRSGTATLGVRSAAVLRCGNLTNGLFRTASASVVEVAPLVVEGLDLGPAPLVNASWANLTGRIEGGLPPYEVTVQWGNSAPGTRQLTAPGPFRWSHAFVPGTYSPEVVVTDSAGNTASATVAQPLQVNPDAAAAVTASTDLAEVGRAVEFTATFSGLPRTAVARLSGCGRSVVNSSGIPPQLTCTPTSAGALAVSLEALAGSDWPVLTQTLEEPVAPALAVQVTAPAADGELGTTAVFDVRVSGGAPPFALAWSFEGGKESGDQLLAEDGTWVLAVEPGSLGVVPLSLAVTDADGATGSVSNATLFVVPALGVALTANSSLQPSMAQVDLAASVSGGEGPVAWVLLSTPFFTSGDPPTGWLPGAAPFRWSGAFACEGVGLLALTVVDAAGAVANGSAAVSLVPPLTGEVAVSALNASEGPGVTVTLNLSGGAPPFWVGINASGGASWNATDPSDGLFAATVPTVRTGPSSVTVVAVDRLGAKLVGSTFVITRGPPGPAPSPTSSTAPYLEGGFLGVTLLALAVALHLRLRRRPTDRVPIPDPVQVLHRILAPADGAERVTVELLAEEAGIPLDTVRATLTHLIATGKVRSEVSADGEEVLAWSDALPD